MVIALAGLALSFVVKWLQPECCSCYAGTKLGSGIALLWSKRVTVECSCAANMGCRAQYAIIPVDFIILSLLVGCFGIVVFRKSNHKNSSPQI
jgi:hypothetical protein